MFDAINLDWTIGLIFLTFLSNFRTPYYREAHNFEKLKNKCYLCRYYRYLIIVMMGGMMVENSNAIKREDACNIRHLYYNTQNKQDPTISLIETN